MFIDAKLYVETKTKEERQAHLKLDEQCRQRGGNSTNHRGVLAEFLNTSIPKGRTILAHACNNSECSNPRHLYWATDRENIIEDGVKFGTHQNPWERMVKKYGEEEARRMQGAKSDPAKAGAGNKGKKKSPEHRKKIAEAIKRKYSKETIGRVVE